MSAHNTGDSSRKPSGSSTHSGTHSPNSSPGNAQSQRKITPNSAANMFGVGMGSSNGLKGLNSGWQVWGSNTPSSKRNASISSATSATDLSPAQADPNYRANLGEGWTPSRPTSGTWEDSNGSPQKKDYSQLQDAHSSLSLHSARQRQALSAPRIDERQGAKNTQYSPQRYEGLNKDSTNSRYTSSASPTKPFGSNTYSSQQPLPGPGGFESLQVSSVIDNDLSLTLRGMAVEDDYGQQSRQQNGPSNNSQGQSNGQIRPGPPMPQPRAPYNAYGQDYAYYSNPQQARDSYADYGYSFDAYRAQGIHPNSASDMHRQPGVFYDYGVANRPGSQFFYPTQTMMYPPSSMVTPQMQPAVPATLGDKKRELQYNIQQQIVPHNLMYSLRSSPSPHPQAYAAAMDYGSQMPVMMPGNMYSHNPQGLPVYPQGMRPNRRNDVAEPAFALRSPLLDEFRANKARKWELRDILGYIVEFSGDQHGSRFIQQKLENATSEEKQLVFDEIVPDNTLQLIQDVFGNYVIQKLFEHGTQVQKTLLANTMEGHILPLSLQMYGCRVVQKAVEYILPEQQGAFVRELDAHVLKCVKDANGNHVIQKLIERVSPDRLGFVNAFRGNVYDLSTHPYGCRVLQRCLEHLPEEHTRPLMEELHQYCMNLMQDQFGNYVIQFVLEHGKPQDRALVMSKLHGHMLKMARHKFASNVCEKALVTADSETRRILIDEIMNSKQDGGSPIVTMMKDQFANYVLQRALAVVEGDQKEALINQVRPQLVSMRRYSSAYSKHLTSIERLLEKFPVSQTEYARAHATPTRTLN